MHQASYNICTTLMLQELELIRDEVTLSVAKAA